MKRKIAITVTKKSVLLSHITGEAAVLNVQLKRICSDILHVIQLILLLKNQRLNKTI